MPTRNEARNLEVVLPAIAAVRPAVHEIIVVDGHSTDDSIGAARRALPWVRAITQTRKGKGNAMACGFAAATGDVIVMFDADGSADPAEIPAFVAALVAGADFAKGSRFAPGGGSDDITLLRRTGNAGLNGVANALFGTSYTDLCYGYNAFWADLLPAARPARPHHPRTRRRHALGRRLRDRDRAQLPRRRRRPADHRGPLRRTPAHLRRDEPADLRRRHPRAAYASSPSTGGPTAGRRPQSGTEPCGSAAGPEEDRRDQPGPRPAPGAAS